MEFAAVGSVSQNVTVTAKEVEWEATVESTAAEWLKISVEGDVITVSVEDNDLEEVKTGKIVVSDKGDYVGDVTITVTLKAKDPDPEPEYSVAISNFTFVAGDYFGEDNDDGIGMYTAVMSLDFDRVLVSGDPGEDNQELHANDVFYLTFFSEAALDAEYALPEAGRYNVSSTRALSSVLEGKTKIGDAEYEGSYVVSTIEGVAQESKITGGYIEISYVDGKCVFVLNLEDEGDVMEKYADVELKFTGDGTESFTNEAIVYHIFNNPGSDYIRCWYWGEPLNSSRESEDGTPLGEYMFVFSNAEWAEPLVEGEVATSFSLMEEYQLYGLDRIIKPGVYPVNQNGFKGELGSIYLSAPENRTPYSGTITIDVVEDGVPVVHYIEDGWMAVFGDENGTPNRFVVNFVREDGKKFYGRYDGELPIGDEWTLSNFREDITLNNLADGYMRIKNPDWRYSQAGTNQWQVFLMGDGVSVSTDQWGYITIHGPGDCFRLEFSTDASATDSLPAGTYELLDSYEAGVAQYGNKTIGYIGIYNGAWFHRIPGGGEDQMHGMGLTGTVNVSKSGSTYTIEATLYDDAKNTLYGKYVGVPTIEDHRTPAGAPARPYQYAGPDFSKDSDSSPMYIKAREQRIERVQPK